VLDGAAGIKEMAAVGEGVGGDVDDAHDEGAGADGMGDAVNEPGLGRGGHGIREKRDAAKATGVLWVPA
jgi:hypothetical protein